MMRRLIAALVFVLSFSTAVAQDQITSVEFLQGKVDSLNALKKKLQQQLTGIDNELNKTKSLLQLHQMEQVEAESVILLTNMEASLRSSPSPDGRVIRILPAKTPLVAADYNGAYWKVRYQGIDGWVMRLFVDEGDGASELKQKLEASNDNATGISSLGPSNHSDERIGKRFLITDFGIHPPNSAGGVSIFYAFEHLDSTRTVREVTFSITPYNDEGLKEKGMNSGTSTKRLRRFGPISVHDGERHYQFENVWYNSSIRCAQIDRVDIIYTDGSRVSHRQDVVDILAGSIENDCTMTAADQIIAPPGND